MQLCSLVNQMQILMLMDQILQYIILLLKTINYQSLKNSKIYELYVSEYQTQVCLGLVHTYVRTHAHTHKANTIQF